MLSEINKYVRIYFNYQRVHIHYHKLYNKFNFILSNDEDSFHIINMNFIIDILSMRNSYIDYIFNNANLTKTRILLINYFLNIARIDNIKRAKNRRL